MIDADGGDGPIERTGSGSPSTSPNGADEPAAAPAAPADPDGPTSSDPAGVADDEVILEDIHELEEEVQTEAGEYLERLQRLQAEFENYRKRMTREQADAAERGARNLTLELLPVLDGCEGALQQGREDVAPIYGQLMELLGKAGLERNAEPGDPFDPEQHEAVMHEPADDAEESAIAEVLRTGYSWKGRVLRPAMVKVRG